MRHTEHPESTQTARHASVRRRLVLALLGAVVMLASCGGESPSTVDRPAEEVVSERAQARWDALIAGDYETAYGYSSPAYRSATSLQRFSAGARGSIRRTDAEVESVTCEEDRCKVVVMVSYIAVVRQPVSNTRALEETWILSDGDWWIHL